MGSMGLCLNRTLSLGDCVCQGVPGCDFWWGYGCLLLCMGVANAPGALGEVMGGERMGRARFVVVSGCSGGGKSTLLGALAARGHAVVEEPGRRIVAQELASGGGALPWVDLGRFIDRAMEVAREDYRGALARYGAGEWVFFDRGLVDAVGALAQWSGEEGVWGLLEGFEYWGTVFLTPPWPEIYVQDHERRHGLEEAVREYERLCRVYPSLGYEVVVLPKVSVDERVDFVLEWLGMDGGVGRGGMG